MSSKIKTELLDWMGDDLAVANAARVSFDKQSSYEYSCACGNDPCPDGLLCFSMPKLAERDKKLIQYLGRGMTSQELDDIIVELSNTVDQNRIEQLLWKFRRTPEHLAPFGHCYMKFRVHAPVFVARQLVKHKFLRMSEVSRRYVSSSPSFYSPDKWRGKAKNNKQGSEGTIDLSKFNLSGEGVVSPDGWEASLMHGEYNTRGTIRRHYQALLDAGVAPEMARMILPQCMMTTWIWSGSLDAFANMCNLRIDDHAQEESRMVAQAISKEASELFPVSWEALTRK
ncbi:MAG: thymidylate synthase (FAD) [Sandaracinus sp.]|nr:thymidylate synthase (FAD) [Sandaracinus sp.]